MEDDVMKEARNILCKYRMNYGKDKHRHLPSSTMEGEMRASVELIRWTAAEKRDGQDFSNCYFVD